MPDAGNIGRDFRAISQTHTRDFAYGRIGFFGRNGRNLRAYTAFKRRRIKNRTVSQNIKAELKRGRARTAVRLGARMFYKLINCRHNNKKVALGYSPSLAEESFAGNSIGNPTLKSFFIMPAFIDIGSEAKI